MAEVEQGKNREQRLEERVALLERLIASLMIRRNDALTPSANPPTRSVMAKRATGALR